MRVLPLIAESQTNQQIARTLILSAGMVKSYTSPIYGKLAGSSHTQTVAGGWALGVL
ncbi:MAG: hypothetical protein H6631_11530 [Anaerolineaceae bacterium]|nr:hypothetical protein [Anaerolineaceae bacterium]MCB9102600.1 hypothetical protein [Anaerolineales bacterium]